jgi:uroporphyrinogen-III synthase
VTGVLSGVRVLVTRPASASAPLADRLAMLGATPITVPLTHIVPSPVAAHAWESVATADRVVFTSANGVREGWSMAPEAVRTMLHRHDGIFVVGPATAQAATAVGMRVQGMPEQAIAEALVATLLATNPRRVLWIRGREARDVLPSQLAARGVALDEIVVYRSTPSVISAADRAKLTAVDVVTLASPSAVRRFAELGGGATCARIICIGPVTARAAFEVGLDVHLVAEQYTTEGLLAAVCAVIWRLHAAQSQAVQ